MVTQWENKLWLVWKDTNTRERFTIGLLSFQNNMYCFEYLEDEGENNLSKDMEKGFSLLPAFQDVKKKYSSPTLFDTFFNRLPDRKRRDVQQFFTLQKLPMDCSDFEFLRETGGRLPTDTMEFAMPIVADKETEFNINFYVAGVSHYNIENAKAQLIPGTDLKLSLEPNNKFDSHAIEVLTANDIKLGYIPVFYSHVLDLEVKKERCTAEIVSFNSNADYREMLEIRVSGKSTQTDIIENIGR